MKINIINILILVIALLFITSPIQAKQYKPVSFSEFEHRAEHNKILYFQALTLFWTDKVEIPKHFGPIINGLREATVENFDMYGMGKCMWAAQEARRILREKHKIKGIGRQQFISILEQIIKNAKRER